MNSSEADEASGSGFKVRLGKVCYSFAMTYTELRDALETFKLSDRATLCEIKSRHRELVKLHHPDCGAPTEPGLISRINASYAVLLAYVNNYRFSFAEDEFYIQNPDEQLSRRFADPLWGER